MCGERRRGRAARVPPRNKHRMHERGPDSAVSRRRRWSLGGSWAGAGSRGYESEGWMDGRVVSYQGRAGSCGSTILAKGSAGGGRERDGSVVLAWCYPHPPGMVGWGDRYAVPSPVLYTTPRARTFRFSDNVRRR